MKRINPAPPGSAPVTPPVSPPVVPKTLEEQKTDFTAEGSPPPGTLGSATHGNVKPALPADTANRTGKKQKQTH